jgi:hypothetical protein
MGSWRNAKFKQPKKVVYAIDSHNLNKVVKDHENRGWLRASDNKEYGYGLGCLMVWQRQ